MQDQLVASVLGQPALFEGDQERSPGKGRLSPVLRDGGHFRKELPLQKPLSPDAVVGDQKKTFPLLLFLLKQKAQGLLLSDRYRFFRGRLVKAVPRVQKSRHDDPAFPFYESYRKKCLPVSFRGPEKEDQFFSRKKRSRRQQKEHRQSSAPRASSRQQFPHHISGPGMEIDLAQKTPGKYGDGRQGKSLPKKSLPSPPSESDPAHEGACRPVNREKLGPSRKNRKRRQKAGKASARRRSEKQGKGPSPVL